MTIDQMRLAASKAIAITALVLALCVTACEVIFQGEIGAAEWSADVVTHAVDEIGATLRHGASTEFPVPNGGDSAGIALGPDNNLWFTQQLRNGVVDALPYLVLVLLIAVTAWYQQRQIQARNAGQQSQINPQQQALILHGSPG